MKQLLTALALAVCAFLYGSGNAFGQASSAPAASKTSDAGITPNGVIGEVTAIDAATSQLTIKTDAGASVTVMLDEKTLYMRVPPGEKTLDKAVRITLAEVGMGDRVYARGKVAEDSKTIPARALVVMTKADITQKQERERAEWRRRGVVGVISALNPQTKEITLNVRGREMAQPMIIPAAANVKFRRYAPDSIKFSDAKPSSFAELRVGDQLRALGDRSADGVRFTPEEVVSGSFRTLAGTVTAVNAAANEVKINDLQNRQPLTVVVSKDSVLRRIPAEFAAMLAQRGGPGGPAVGGGGGDAAPPAAGAAPPPRTGTQQPPPGGASGGGGPRARGGMDLQERLESMPPVTVAELKPGDMIIVSSTTGADPTRVTAIHLVAGAEPLLNMMQARQAAGRNASGPAQRGPSLDINFGIGTP